jgi:cation:H+ antiporter
MLIAVVLLVAGLALLVWAADQLVTAAARLSLVLRITPVVIGVVVIGFGTSMPELVVSGLAAIEGLFDLGVGNVIGSNIANVLLVLGAAALIAPVTVTDRLLRREVPLTLAAVAAFAWAIQGPLRVADAILLVVLLVAILIIIITLARRDGALDLGEVDALTAATTSTGRESLRAVVGLTLTIAGAQMVVIGGGAIAEGFGLSEGFVGLTLVAVGTSLPELATSVQAVRRGESELLVGNVLGSNLFNAVAVGPLLVWSGANLGRTVATELAGIATIAMVVAVAGVSLLLVVRRRLGRLSGALMLLVYVAVVVLLGR